ncbi:MAG: hypothetical protein COU83_02810 [Candidatus Portnoybacteria bacterium CG10_big_fil_rev_8_21_14_0_10_40_22]|uniref:Lipoprotein n=1 Tax=Candidatus Portnoybacteria bacterium CG10_big_fil_rev_8_21_14_0_10_40_22 TaxID=1974814 RepID=A0A2M8KFD7_9BACT|nr:MAG: hypothetical protein COU83_02810 [Candidatus Portnoybacteria bacterium CG10_big_fil_rev_8_21_14_0_10_40_22]
MNIKVSAFFVWYFAMSCSMWPVKVNTAPEIFVIIRREAAHPSTKENINKNNIVNTNASDAI